MASLRKSLVRQIGISPESRPKVTLGASPDRNGRSGTRWRRHSKSGLSPCAHDVSKVGPLLNEFVQAASAVEIMRVFGEVVKLAGVGPGREVDLLPALAASFKHALQADGSHRPKQLFAALAERRAKPQYVECVPACRGLCAVVLGGGPIGLRAAIELALCGVSVHLVESRDAFVRLNVLHLWEWVEADLVELGLKVLDPSAFASADFKHLATCQMQHSLLKVALLLGVHAHFSCPVLDLATLQQRGFYAVGNRPEPGAKVHARYHLLVDATGARCPLFDSLDFEQVTVLKSAQALGLVCHMRNGRSSYETQLQESNWSHQFHQARFAKLAKAGVTLQNIVYYRSSGAFSEWATHYFVMTAQAGSMLQYGALLAPASEDSELCARSNLDLIKLEGYARVAISEFVPELDQHELVPNQLQLFDFSERKQSNRAVAMLPSARLAGRHSHSHSGAAVGGSSDAPVMITRVSDALQG